jgi:hypothetical protein
MQAADLVLDDVQSSYVTGWIDLGPAGGPVLEVTGTTRLVSIDLDATKQGLVRVDEAVEVVLPDDTATTGTISSVGSVAEAGPDSDGDGSPDSSIIEVLAALDDPRAAGSLDEAPVTVRLVTSVAVEADEELAEQSGELTLLAL